MGWAGLVLLLAALLAGAVTFDRREWRGLLGDEATYLMQSQSLAWDQDLRYTADDFRRFRDQWDRPPDGLILQSSDGGDTLVYGKPFFYGLWLAPFVRIAPVRGAAIANTVLLAFAAIVTARTLKAHLGAMAPLWTTVFVFGSVLFAHVWWAHADLFLACLLALALAVVYRGPGGSEEDSGPARARSWAFAGGLVAVVTLSRPFYGALLLPVALATSGARRRKQLLALGGGFLLVLGLSLAANFAVRGTWTAYGATRAGFYSHTGFPEIDSAVALEKRFSERPGAGAWVGEGKLGYHISPRLLAYDLLYFLSGRHVGIGPYFLPFLLGFAAFSPRRGRWALPVAVALATAGFLYVRAFNFYGGGGALANRYFLPLYPALWFVAGRRIRTRRALGAAVIVVLAAAPFLWPLWSEPRRYPLVEDGATGYVSRTARALLPYETSLSHLKPAGREDRNHHGLWIKFLAPEPRPVSGGDWFRLSPASSGEILVGHSRPLEELILEVRPPAPRGLHLKGTESGEPRVREGLIRYLVDPGRPTARHRMWWTRNDVWLYRFEIAHEGVEPLLFRLRPRR
ncbi:MAG: hypothetical protein R3234_07380 [Thermoanaerobaculia bacterium]|nr:hypothetical protein [Thermoanaerobaculia bacterium]